MLRPGGDPTVRARVEAALTTGQACWCPLVRLELWNGASGQQEQKVLQEFASTLPELPIDENVWQEACDLARRARGKGVTAPATDVIIAACARWHGVDLEAADTDFEFLASVSDTPNTPPTQDGVE